MIGLAVVFLHLVLLLVPGLLAVMVLRIRHVPWLSAYLLSWCFLVYLRLLVRIFDLDAVTMLGLWLAGVALLAVAVLWRVRQRHQTSGLALLALPRETAVGAMIVAALWSAYSLWAGSPTEVPGDWLLHLIYVEQGSDHLLGRLPNVGSIWHKFNHYGHVVWSVEHALSSATYLDLLPLWGWLNPLVMVLVGYGFSLNLYRDLIEPTGVRTALAVVAQAAMLLLFGISGFVLLRYYAYAPVIFAFPAFLVAGLWGWRWIESRWNGLLPPLLVAFSFLPLALAHTQEAMFLGLMLGMMTLIAAYRCWGLSKSLWQCVRQRPVWLSVLGTIAFVALFAYAWIYFPRNGVDPPLLIPLQSVLPFARNLYVLNPLYQFYEVVGSFGLAIYLVAWIYRDRWRNNLWLCAALLSPFFTVFNPIFVDFFLRFGSTITLWRGSYLTQLYWMLPLLGYWLWQDLDRRHRWPKVAVLTALLVISLLPLQTRYFQMGPDRWQGIAPIPAEARLDHWQDLLQWLDQLPPGQRVVSDPVTSFLAGGVAEHRHSGYKFLAGGNFRYFLHDTYEDHPLDRYRGHLLIVNLRDGEISPRAAAARHWRPRDLQPSLWFPTRLLDYVSREGERFQRLWRSDDGKIIVYRIRSPLD
ncbi:hypothetical protein OAS86_03230 [Gammaproteobacteria bacterium]|nr:hypothetical protein [Gammaproteobacteria bacterium]